METRLDGWAMLETRDYGARLYGYVDEVVRGTVTFIRLHVPDGQRLRVARIINAQHVIAITPVSETLARENAARQWRGGR